MNPLRSVGARLSLALVLVVAGALGLVYVIVVPSLERNLVGAKLSQLERAAPTVAEQLPNLDLVNSPVLVQSYLETVSASVDARVVVYQILQQQPPALLTYEESTSALPPGLENDPVALGVAETYTPQSGVVTVDGRRFAEAAVPISPERYVLLLRAPLRDSLGNVHLVQRRLLIAGLIALVASLAVGYGAASLFARRLRRLERAAERIASGDFGEPVVDRQADEIGELASAFERMRQRLAQLDDARREFIANASHELRTPLFSLGGFLELLADEDLDDETRDEFLGTMREQVDRLTKLATDLLDLSRLDAGRIHLHAERFDLGDVARELVEEFAAVARSTDHPLEVAVSGDPIALGDAERAFQIGRALVENAIRHTPPGTRIRVFAGRRRDRAVLTVEDEGPGIPPEHRTQVFERFYRVDGTSASGSGLGLAIAWELTELMGGSIELASRAGLTVFTVLLPGAPVEAPPRVLEPAAS